MVQLSFASGLKRKELCVCFLGKGLNVKNEKYVLSFLSKIHLLFFFFPEWSNKEDRKTSPNENTVPFMTSLEKQGYCK